MSIISLIVIDTRWIKPTCKPLWRIYEDNEASLFSAFLIQEGELRIPNKNMNRRAGDEPESMEIRTLLSIPAYAFLTQKSGVLQYENLSAKMWDLLELSSPSAQLFYLQEAS